MQQSDLALWVWTGASECLRCYWPGTGKAPGPSVVLTSPSAPGHLPETPHEGPRHEREPWREERNGRSDQYNSTLHVLLNVTSIKRDSYSPSRLHSTRGAGRPLTRHWNSTSWPSTTVSSCSLDAPEITGGAAQTPPHVKLISIFYPQIA